MNRKYLTVLALIVLLLIARAVVLGGASEISLKSAPQFSGLVAQSLSKDLQSPTLVPGRDFDLQNVKFLDNNAWVVARIHPLKANLDPGVVVFNRQNGGYQVALGPGSAFDSSYLLVMPPDVGKYLNSQGVVNGPIEQ